MAQTEADTCRKYVLPKLYASSWNDDQISEQKTYTDGQRVAGRRPEMNRKERKPVAESIVQMQRELEEYRRSRPRRAKLPESIWEAATALARQHGLYAVTQALRLDYMGLKKRLGDVPSQRPANSRPVFAFRSRLQLD